jgi:hypothetical protein
MVHLGKFSRKAISENTPKNTRKSMLANTLGDGVSVNCGHRLALKPTHANQGDQNV